MRRGSRKSTPRVIKGVVQKKNNWDYSPDYYYKALEPHMVTIDRKRPGVGHRHLLTVADVRNFLAMLPDWNNLAVGLNAVVLAPGSGYYDGYYRTGVVHVCAWEADLWTETDGNFYKEHRALFERLGVKIEPLPGSSGDVLCKWEEYQARAYQLLHILLHELGHHHDRITTRRQKRAARGEPYAEAYALEHEARIWDDYQRVFGF